VKYVAQIKRHVRLYMFPKNNT